MNSFKIPYNQIENKIRQFKVGTDYRLPEEEYHAPNEAHKGYTIRTYQINSPQLHEILQEYLKQQNAILMSFDFKGWAHVMERVRPDEAGKGKNWEEKFYSSSQGENGNGLNFGVRGNENNWNLSIVYHDKPLKSRENFNQRYQQAKQDWEAKGSPLNNIPPSGTKCWSCYEVIFDSDIVAGRYRLENTRLNYQNGKNLTFFKTFEHVKEHGCKPKECDVAQRNNYGFHGELIDEWLKTWPQKKHEISCQDCLTRMWHSVNGNLIYLETWTKEQKELIDSHKQVLAEIKARLGVLEKTGEYHNCGIKKCCAERDKPDHSKSINDNKGLIAAAPVEKDFSEPEKPTFDRQEILNWMKEKEIVEISIDPSDQNNLLIKYANGKVNSLEIANDLPQEWGNFLKREVSSSPISLNSQNSPQGTENNLPGGVIAAFSLLAVGLVALVGMLIYRQRKLKKT